MGPPPWTPLSLLWTKLSTHPQSPADGTQLSPGCTQISPQVGTQLSPQWTQQSTGWTLLSPPYIQHKNFIINLTHLKMEYWKNSFGSRTLYQSFNLMMDQNYKNVKKTIQVGLH